MSSLRGLPILLNDKRVVCVGALPWEPEGSAPAANVQELEPGTESPERSKWQDCMTSSHDCGTALSPIRHTGFFDRSAPVKALDNSVGLVLGNALL